MVTPIRFFGFDSLMEFIAFAIASAVAFQALKGYRLSRERTLLYLNVSFGLLGAGLFIDACANLIVFLARFHAEFLFLYSIGYTINFVAQLLAYGILVFAYIQQSRDTVSQVAMAAAPALLFVEYNAVSKCHSAADKDPIGLGDERFQDAHLGRNFSPADEGVKRTFGIAH